ncbi:minor tail protein [Mycobacterium phage Indlulamithi]|uniref:Minor tail protein n=1 Tax=Mycobacterium phage Indlulamithi TaxID=2656582 RepID=A0A649VCL6_9CAUD|nr:minor tail protein [Mycobacterium phage Indlulamithi]QGJ90067.1 minor tail protein [Mycobacterium phage Indlulamithi]
MATLELVGNWTPYASGSRAAQDKRSPMVAVGGGIVLKPKLTLQINSDALLATGDFEGIVPPPWMASALPSQFSWATDQKHSGTRSLKLGAHSAGSTIGPASVKIPVQSTDRFRAGLWARRDSAYASTDSKMRIYDATAGSALIATVDYTGASTVPQVDTWTQRTSGIWGPPAGCNEIAFRLQRNGTTGTVWVDDVVLEQYYTAVTQLVEFHIIAFGPSGEVLSDTTLGTYSAAANTVGTTANSVVLGGNDYTVPKYTKNVQLSVRVSDKFNFGTISMQPSLTMTAQDHDAKTYYDRFHYWVQDIHGNWLTKDLVGQDASLMRVLSGPAQLELKIHPKDPSVQMPGEDGPIQFKPWGHIVHAMKEDLNGNEVPWISTIVQPSDVDPQTGVLSLRGQGFSGYANGIPWLQNWNPISVDPFEVIWRIWQHIQSYPQGDLGVTVYPTVSGTQMLPGFSFENEEFVQNFFAIFIRAVDRNDCGDYINKLARDIPIDYFEESVFNAATNKIDKKIRLAYPQGGVDQTDLIFRLGENVSAATPKQETEINWFSDITIKGYFPGKEYSATISNADTDRLRRVMDEQDLHVDSNERAAAWGRRRLTRRQIPYYFESIVVDPYHPNAPFGSFDVGDLIRYQGPMHWKGNIDQKHKVMMMGWDEAKGQMELKTMAEGAFNYDPIVYGAG